MALICISSMNVGSDQNVSEEVINKAKEALNSKQMQSFFTKSTVMRFAPSHDRNNPLVQSVDAIQPAQGPL